jgi:lysozyme
MKRRDLLAVFSALALMAGAVAYFNPFAAGQFVHGVDVSNHQGAIDWRALSEDGVSFAYVKASEGASFVDARFAANWRAAADAGLYVGAYHFFTLCRPGAAQAAHFVSLLPRETTRALPPALDAEHMGPCKKGPTIEDVAAEVDAFLDVVERDHGVRPIVYTTRQFHDAHLKEMRGERFWVRSLFHRPDFRSREWVFWQHSNRGEKRGVAGPVDLNVFRGDAAALARLAGTERNRAMSEKS